MAAGGKNQANAKDLLGPLVGYDLYRDYCVPNSGRCWKIDRPRFIIQYPVPVKPGFADK